VGVIGGVGGVVRGMVAGVMIGGVALKLVLLIHSYRR
jgi:hypothetical protein